MEIFGVTIARTKALNLSPVRSTPSWWATIREPFTGAWQRNVECAPIGDLTAFSAVDACVGLISDDIAKLRIKLVEQDADGIWDEVSVPAFSPVLRKPNRYQTRIQFLSQWITSKLLYGNAYILKERDRRPVVTEMFVLDPKLVTTLVAEDGSVYYQLKRDDLSGLSEPITVPASEIIHDRMKTLWHPLIGASPIHASGASATQGMRIQANSARFFENMSRPSIHLAAPGKIDETTANRIKQTVETATGGGNIGRVLVTGDGMKMDVMTIPASDAQLIEQLRWTVEDVARCFHVPLHKLNMGQPTLNNIAALNQDYYNQCLQKLIEDVELLLDEGLGLVDVEGHTYGIELDLDGLLRMDPLSVADAQEKGVRAGIVAPNEARKKLNLGPVVGGSVPYLQQQNYALPDLEKRSQKPDPFETTPTAAPTPPALPAPAKQEEAAKNLEAIVGPVADRVAAVETAMKAIPTPPEIDYERIVRSVASVIADAETKAKEAMDQERQEAAAFLEELKKGLEHV